MSFFGKSSSTLLAALSDFWQTLFADKDELNALYSGTEVLLGQAYLDLLHQVLNSSLKQTPIFEKEYWKALILRDNEVLFREGEDAPYRVPLRGGLATFEMLCNRVYNSTLILERQTDFIIDEARRELGFYENPFKKTLPGVAKRQLRMLPVIYLRGVDGISDGTAEFEVAGRYKEGLRGRVSLVAPRRFLSSTDVFSVDDVGSVLHFFDGGTRYTAVVQAVIGPKAITISEDVVFEADDVRWGLFREEVFTQNDVGRDIFVRHTDAVDAPQVLRIEEVLGAKRVRLSEAVVGNANDAVSWRLQSTEAVEELAFWVPAAHIDRHALYFSFGYLVDRFESSSETYRALLEGIFRYFMLGPALSRMESALNVMVGVPVTRTDGETILRIDTSEAEFDRIITSVTFYDIPKGSLDKGLEVGSTLSAFQSLTRIFTVTDYVEDPTWFYGKTVPEKLLEIAHGDRRSADPRLYDNVVGVSGDKWVIGDPETFIGAEEGQRVTLSPRGSSYFLEVLGDDTNQSVRLFGKPVKEEDLGKLLYLAQNRQEGHIESVHFIEHADEVLSVVELDRTMDATYGGDTQIREVFSVAGAALEAPAILSLAGTGVAFDADYDRGRLLYVEPSIEPPFYARIADVVSKHKAYLEDPRGEGIAVVSDAAISVQFAGDWLLEHRPAQRHTTGFTAMSKYLKYHVLYVQYDLSTYNTPHPHPQTDIEEVLRQGAPAYTFIYVAPSTAHTEYATVADSFKYVPALRVKEAPFLHFGAGSIGDGWKIGAWFAYDGVDKTVWFKDVRGSDFGDIAILEGSQDQGLVFFGLSTDAPSEVELTLYAVNGAIIMPLGVTQTLSPSGSMMSAYDPQGLKLAVKAELVSGTPAQYGVAIGYRKTLPDMIVRTLPEAHHLTGTFTDLVLTSDTARFSELDALKHIEVAFPSGTVGKFFVEEVLSETQVLLRADRISEAVWVEENGAVSFFIGYSRRVMTPHIISGMPPARDQAGNALYSWPLHAVLRQVI